MRRRSPAMQRPVLSLELLEQRLVLSSGPTVIVPLDPVSDQFGDQVVTVQGYQDKSRTDFGIFDTGASIVTFSAAAQAHFTANNDAIPIKVPNGAVVAGVGGPVVGDVSQPGTVLVDGLHAVSMKFTGAGVPTFDVHFGANSAAAAGIQSFVGNSTGSPTLPTVSGTPVLTPGPGQLRGLAAQVNMHDAQLNFSPLSPGLNLALPDLNFVAPGTALAPPPGASPPLKIPLTLFGADNHLHPGNSISDAPSPVQTNVSVSEGASTLSHLKFLFDTGAQVTVVTSAVAQALGVDLSQGGTVGVVTGIGGTEQAEEFTLSKLDLPLVGGGTLEYTSVPIFVVDVANGLDGILGMNLFNPAAAFLYDPYGSAGASYSVSFYQDGVGPGDGSGPSTGGVLQEGGVPFGPSVDGNGLPIVPYQPSGTISGRVFVDFDRDGNADPSEPGLPGQTVFLDMNGTGSPGPGDPTAQTGGDGSYSFTNLPPGTYSVHEVLPSGFIQISPSGGFVNVDLKANENAEVDFGNVPVQHSPGNSLIAGLYGSILHRAAEPAGMDFWSQQIQAGVPRQVVTQSIWESAEHRGLEVDTYYQNFLHRPADAAGRQYWTSLFQAGASEADVMSGFLQSGEYQAAHRDNTSFLSGLYNDLFSRQADPSGLSAWQQSLGNGTSRQQVITDFVQADENYNRIIKSYYQDFLNRPAEPVGLQAWETSVVQKQRTLDSVAEAVLASDEYFAKTRQFTVS